MINLTFHSGRPVNQAPAAPASPSARALLRKRIQAKAEASIKAATTEPAPPPVSGQKRAYSLLATEEVLNESDSENDFDIESESEKTYYSAAFLREERRYFSQEENQRFTHADWRYIKKVFGERGLAEFADYIEASMSPEMVNNKIDKIVAECLNGRKACKPDFVPKKVANPSSGYSNHYQTFQPLMDRFKQHLNKDDFEAVLSIIEKAKTEELSDYDRSVVNCLYAELPILPGQEFSWDS